MVTFANQLLSSFNNLKSFYEEEADQWETFRSIIVPHKTANGKFFLLGADVAIESGFKVSKQPPQYVSKHTSKINYNYLQP